jgi:hypothetical protein
LRLAIGRTCTALLCDMHQLMEQQSVARGRAGLVPALAKNYVILPGKGRRSRGLRRSVRLPIRVDPYVVEVTEARFQPSPQGLLERRTR